MCAGIDFKKKGAEQSEKRKITELKSFLEENRVIYRATPKHKLMVLNGLQYALEADGSDSKRVLVTGDGINDVQAITDADVGMAMGSGCSSAKIESDLILTDDDFEATLRSIMWGRNIFQNVGRFLQF